MLLRPKGKIKAKFIRIGQWTVGFVARLEVQAPRCTYMRERKLNFRVWLPLALTVQQGRTEYRGGYIITLFIGALALGISWQRKRPTHEA